MRAIWILLLLCCGAAQTGFAAGKAKHMVIVVWDGMRPDFVSESNTPTLHALARGGVFFQNNHCVFLSSTEVNGTALATGAYPQRSGVIANREFRPDLDSHRPIATSSLNAIRKAEEHESYLNVPTLAEILHRHGHRTAIAGTKPLVLLHDRAARGDGAADTVLFEGRTLPPTRLAGITNLLGPFPESGDDKANRDLWTTRALIGPLWEKGVPAFSLLWLAEPDSTQHATGVGSQRALAAMRHSDHALALVIQALKDRGVYESTDIFVVSDHGFSTIERTVNVAARLRENGFNATREFGKTPAKGDVLVVGLGGSALLYVAGHDRKTIDRLVRFLQTEEYVGVIFTRRARPGTFPLSKAMIASEDAPDIGLSLRWTDAVNPNGAPGYVVAESQNPGVPNNLRGTHVSLSPFDLHNTLIASGPDFRRGHLSATPSGNVDVAPTILHLLGIKPHRKMDGRVLFEALAGYEAKPPKVRVRESKAGTKTASGQWSQELSVSEVKGVVYLERGNGQVKPRR